MRSNFEDFVGIVRSRKTCGPRKGEIDKSVRLRELVSRPFNQQRDGLMTWEGLVTWESLNAALSDSTHRWIAHGTPWTASGAFSSLSDGTD